MTPSPGTVLSRFTPDLAERLYSFTAVAAAQPDVKSAVEANHDDNRWWPAHVRDWRVRMAVAGWSSRVSYAMISTYADVVARADVLGWDRLTGLTDHSLASLVHPLGLSAVRVSYLRSLAAFIDAASRSGIDLATASPDDLIASFTQGVRGAGYKTAQCAVLYARGYHCGVIPVDSGMVTKLAPLLGVTLAGGTAGHEHLRQLLQSCAAADSQAYRDLASRLGYAVAIPSQTTPTWFVHLVAIYFKRLYLNRPRPILCSARPACPAILGCHCSPSYRDQAQ